MESRINTLEDIVAQYDDVARVYEQNSHEYQQDFDSLFQFISKNKSLKGLMTDEYYAQHVNQIKQLNEAITQGNHADPVFSDKDCSVFLLHLIKRKDVTFDQGMTVYAYIMANSQFNKDRSKRTLYVEDPVGSNAIECDVLMLGTNHEIFKVGEVFTEYYSHHFADFSVSAFNSFILTLPASERWVIALKYQTDTVRDEQSLSADRLAHLLSATTYGFFPASGSDRSSHYTCYIPSVSVMRYLLKTLFPNHMRMQFAFGSVGESTLQSMHKNNFHPVPLYNPYVKSNMLSAHHYQCGPFIVWMHDMMHTLWASYLSYQERQVALNDFPPVFDRFKNFFNDLGLDKREIIAFFKNQICDFDLSGSGGRAFKDYIVRAIFNHFDKGYLNISEKLMPMVVGALYADQFYLAAMYTLNEKKSSDTEIFILKTILSNVYPELNESMGSTNQYLIDKIFSHPDVMSYAALEQGDQACIQNIAWQQWKQLLDNYVDDATLWQAITQNARRYKEYVNLSQYAGLKFIYPYVPFSNDSLNNFKTFVNERVHVEAREKLKRPLKTTFPNFFEPAPKKLKRVKPGSQVKQKNSKL